MPPSSDREQRRRLQALRVHQWLPDWDEVDFDPKQYRAQPPKDFYLFTLPAAQLRALCGIFRRSTAEGRARSRDLGIQRRHDEGRSVEIHEFVEHGFPWSALSEQRRKSGEFDDLKKPGWLPTAIVVNILKRDETRNGRSVHVTDTIRVSDQNREMAELHLPLGFDDSTWEPSSLAPLEVIDGQHRLWAFNDRRFAEGFSLPVVAFYGLDISWQAYLFYTINIKPKRINTSLAFDLYPLLRTEDWLDRFEGHPIYRETRAQEITEALWSYPKSPWHYRIDMLGGRGGSVTQAAWIRSLLATFVKAYESRRVRVGGLFGAPLGEDRPVLEWSRAQQSAFIILIWQELREAVSATDAPWASELRNLPNSTSLPSDAAALPSDAAFSGKFTLLNNDQGVRGVLAVFNDLCYVLADTLNLRDLQSDEVGDGTSEVAISNALDAFRQARIGDFVTALAFHLANYDWRTSGTPGLTEAERSSKARFRGGTGYRELRSDLLHHVATFNDDTSVAAIQVVEAMDF